MAWLLTLPAAAVVGALAGRVANSGTPGVVIIAIVALAAGLGLYAAARRKPVNAHNVNEYPGRAATAAPAPVA